jgi:hypothetical protein
MLMRQAEKNDFKAGAYLYDSEANEFIVRDKYDDGIFNVDCYSGTRHVGKKVLLSSEASFYKVEA